MPNPCIVLTFHRREPNPFEVISLKQCAQVLGHYPIYLVHPKSIPGESYLNLFPPQTTVDLPIGDKWFSSYRNFQRLKVSYWFFNKFRSHSHLLFYEPDCFVFEDRLMEWCSKPFDYIGAPWTCRESTENGRLKITGVGNGGFSIRKISPTLRALGSLNQVFPLSHYARTHLTGGRRRRPLQLLTIFWKWLVLNRYRTIHTIFDGIEDPFMCKHIPKAFPFFTLAESAEAIKFSFETAPRLLYEANEQVLPFGCHAWWSYDLDFWKPHIEALGHEIDSQAIPELTTSARSR